MTDFFSFYSLPSTIINHTKHNVLNAAYLFYYATETALGEGAEESGRLKKRLEELVGEIPLLASVYHKPAETFVGRGRISADSMQRKSEYVLISIFCVSAPDKPPTDLLMSVHRHKRHSRRSLR